MDRVFTFHETVRGHMHVMRDIPCEDYSYSYSSENGKYYIAIVADGHGSDECFRSACGSKVAALVAFDCLKVFAESMTETPQIENNFYSEMFSDPRYRQTTIRRLTDTIIAGWHDCVREDYQKNPPTEEEMGENVDKFTDENHISHIYGTTLMAALLLPQCLILLHQGDGRCDVFYGDGTVDQPIPWDSRCEDTAVTSMCDDDAAVSFRSCVLNLAEKDVAACYLGCDGVEDAYRDTYESLGGTHELMGGVHTFYKDLTCQLADMQTGDFLEYLKTMLPKFSADGRFSRSGSGDDVSVAGIVDIGAIVSLKEKFALDVKKYELDEELFWKEDELRGKMRKHGILSGRMKDAKMNFDSLKAELHKLEAEQAKLASRHEQMKKYVLQARNSLEQFGQESDKLTSQINQNPAADNPIRKSIHMLGITLPEKSKRLAVKKNTLESHYRKSLDDLLKCESDIRILQQEHQELAKEILLSEKKYNEAKMNFEAYDAKYQAIEFEKNKIVQAIAELEDNSILHGGDKTQIRSDTDGQ